MLVPTRLQWMLPSLYALAIFPYLFTKARDKKLYKKTEENKQKLLVYNNEEHHNGDGKKRTFCSSTVSTVTSIRTGRLGDSAVAPGLTQLRWASGHLNIHPNG